MSKETPLDDPRQQTDQGSHSQTDKPWKGNPEKEQRPGTKKSDLEQMGYQLPLGLCVQQSERFGPGLEDNR